ncbi:MAG: hypothetical protein QHC89_06805 [Bosea sp. (in: a-proteobacteria)]|nr:hypothetical protein [Bosea sp. (in: a-proteobacteria)]
MIDLQDTFNQTPQVLALSMIQQGHDFLPEQVEGLRELYAPDELCEPLRDYVNNYPWSRLRSLRGRKRKMTSVEGEEDNMALIADFNILRCAAEAVRDRRDLSGTQWAAEELIKEKRFNITAEALLNRLSKLRYHVDMRAFWEFVLKRHGEEIALVLYRALRPNGKAFRKKLTALSGPLDEAQQIVAAHHRRLAGAQG